jgi:uncharacterized tellurite resistance protein B-like protein
MLPKSKFNLLRGAIAVAYADGKLMDVERNWLRWYMERLDISPEQEEILAHELLNGTDVYEIIPQITDKEDRMLFLNFANILFRIDGEFHPNEKRMYENIKRLLSIPSIQKISNVIKKEALAEEVETPEDDFQTTDVQKAFELLINRVFDVE